MLTTVLLCPWDSPGKNTGVGCHPDPGIEPRSPALQADVLLTELCRKPNFIFLSQTLLHSVGQY